LKPKKEGREFRSKVEDMIDGGAKELKLPSTAGFKPFDLFFSEESVSHPAKANLHLLYFLIKKYTEEGGVVADIMAGTGSTGIVASYLGRSAVLVELEEKFVEWMEKNVALLESYGKKKGEIKIIQGDTRRLTNLLGVKADSVITSPPYKTATQGGGLNKHPPKSFRGVLRNHSFKLSDNPNNIDNLPSGDIDAVVTSPPYSECEHNYEHGLKALGSNFRGRKAWENREKTEVSHENVGELPHGSIDSIITSPPYSETYSSSKAGKAIRTGETKIHDEKHLARPYTEDLKKDNIGNLSHGSVDAILTSPPYVETKAFHDVEFMEKIAGEQSERVKRGEVKGHYMTEEARKRVFERMEKGKSESPDNIGSLSPGEIDTIVTSPPFGESNQYRGGTQNKDRMMKGKRPTFYSKDRDNIGNLSHGEIDAIVTSPPYSDGFKHNPQDREKRLQKLIEVDKKGVEKGQKWAATSREALERRLAQQDDGYSESIENIGNLPLGDVDAIITSPPYSESMTKKRKGYSVYPDLEKSREMPQETRDDNIANLNHGNIDTIITSPPYADSKKHLTKINLEHEVSRMETDTRPDTKNRHTPGREKAINSLLSGYSESKENIGNLPLGEVDTIITSPPYAESARDSDKSPCVTKPPRKGDVRQSRRKSPINEYSENPENIGNLSYGEKT